MFQQYSRLLLYTGAFTHVGLHLTFAMICELCDSQCCDSVMYSNNCIFVAVKLSFAVMWALSVFYSG